MLPPQVVNNGIDVDKFDYLLLLSNVLLKLLRCVVLLQVANKRNGIDVDKFDYLLRDSKMCGVAVQLDQARLMKLSRLDRAKEQVRLLVEMRSAGQHHGVSQHIPRSSWRLLLCMAWRCAVSSTVKGSRQKRAAEQAPIFACIPHVRLCPY